MIEFTVDDLDYLAWVAAMVEELASPHDQFDRKAEASNNRLFQQANRCALTGIHLQFSDPLADKNLLPSADRIDSKGHYVKGNIQVVRSHSLLHRASRAHRRRDQGVA